MLVTSRPSPLLYKLPLSHNKTQRIPRVCSGHSAKLCYSFNCNRNGLTLKHLLTYTVLVSQCKSLQFRNRAEHGLCNPLISQPYREQSTSTICNVELLFKAARYVGNECTHRHPCEDAPVIQFLGTSKLLSSWGQFSLILGSSVQNNVGFKA